MALGNIAQTYDPNAGYELHLRGPDDALLFNDDQTPMTITVLGADSDIAVKARNAQTNRYLQRGAKAKITAEGSQSDHDAYLAKITLGWSIMMQPGAMHPFSTEAALALYSDPKFSFVREQVDAAIGERANFLKG